MGTALIVEDNAHSALILRSMLEAEGFNVVHAEDVRSALEIAAQQSLALIAVDMDLPDDGGWTFILEIRENSSLAHIPVVIVSNTIDSSVALSSGAAAVLQKPINRRELNHSLTLLGLEPAQFITRKVLVIDDDPKAVELIATFLPLSEYTVVRAYGGSEGIALAERLLPDVIILDLMMPEVNGFDVVGSLQRNGRTSAIPIIIVTAKNITSEDVAELKGGSDMVVAIVEKTSFDRLEFVAGVRRALRQPLEKV
jgi:DNA-binding response OmpR family regulator